MSDALAISATRKTMKELADGTLRVQIDVDMKFKDDFLKNFPLDAPIFLVRQSYESAVNELRENTLNANSFGKYAEALYKSGWFFAPKVIEAFGSDDKFLEYVRNTPCACASAECGGDVVAAHVRRIADGAGVGIKPKYSAIPLCNNHHMMQHQKGESAIGGKEHVDRLLAKVKVDFIKESIYLTFGVSSLAELDKDQFVEFCKEKNIYDVLPLAFKG